jgi:2-keto-4-pentenoate hydratase/2-oxohepta-3-ene-1,7-dioic acid hydratase in catechol pathway
MSIGIVRYRIGDKLHWGRLVGDAPENRTDTVDVLPLQVDVTSTSDLLTRLFRADAIPSGAPLQIAAADLASPVTADRQIVCQGMNYADHAAESNHAGRKDNLIFMKASSSITGPYDDVVRPSGIELLDYEAEVGLVLRQPITAPMQIDETNVGDYVSAVTLCNDISARDEMFGAGFLQWFKGKSFRGFCPTGPVLMALQPDEVVPLLSNLDIWLDWRRTRRQSANTSQFIFSPAQTLTNLSQFMDLAAGDMILTGTPGGVIAKATTPVATALRDHLFDDQGRRSALTAAMPPSDFLQPGDVLRLGLHDAASGRSLGSQETRIVST